MDIKIPFLGDGIDSAIVLSVNVAVGDNVDLDQTIIELETDKAVAPIPTTASGKIQTITVKEGDVVSQGSTVATLEGNSVSASSNKENDETTSAPAPVSPTQQVSTPLQSVQAPASYSSEAYQATNGQAASTSPWIRYITDTLGLDLGRINGTGRSGRITIEDVKKYVNFLQTSTFQANVQETNVSIDTKPVKKDIDFSKWGDVEITPISSLRQKISDNLVDSWNSIPHVTQFDEANISELMTLRKKYVDKYKKKGVRLTVTVLMMKAAVETLKKFPLFNSSIQSGQLITKKYFNIGIAVDTERGLLVPVIKDVDKKSLFQLSEELAEVAEKAKNRRLTLDDMQGGTFTISNLGGLGVGQFTPIVNQPEVAILGLSKGNKKLYLDGSNLLEADMLPLSLSYDHRVIDGADGARFMRTFISELENFNEKALKAVK
jgi:pyruvate dehydrogenase E2 component (dihydrolipoamide acetyltransferase)